MRYKDRAAHTVHITSISHLLDWRYIWAHYSFSFRLFANICSIFFFVCLLDSGLNRLVHVSSSSTKSHMARWEETKRAFSMFFVDSAVVVAILCHNLATVTPTIPPLPPPAVAEVAAAAAAYAELFNRSQNLKFYRYNSVHKSFEAFHIFCHLRKCSEFLWLSLFYVIAAQYFANSDIFIWSLSLQMWLQLFSYDFLHIFFSFFFFFL